MTDKIPRLTCADCEGKNGFTRNGGCDMSASSRRKLHCSFCGVDSLSLGFVFVLDGCLLVWE